MSAIDQLPEDIRALILSKARPDQLRDDLRLIPEAEAAGWTVEFRDGKWHNAAQYIRGDETVWLASTGWRRAKLVDGRYAPPKVHGWDEIALRSALGLVS